MNNSIEGSEADGILIEVKGGVNVLHEAVAQEPGAAP
jgi:hypothetical protein